MRAPDERILGVPGLLRVERPGRSSAYSLRGAVPSAGALVVGTATAWTTLSGGAKGTILYNSAANTPAWLAAGARGSFLINTAAGVPAWLALGAAGKIPRSDGTDILYSTFTVGDTYARGDILRASAINTLAGLAVGAAGKVIRSDGTDPLYSTFTIPDAFAQGSIPHASTANTLTALAVGTAGQILDSNGTIPVWVTVSGDATFASGGALTLASTGVTAAAYGSASSVGTFTVDAKGRLTAAASVAIAIDASAITSGTLGVARGGTGLASYTVGDILYASGATTLAGLADVATGNAVISGGVGVAPSYGKIGLTTHVSGTLPIANGGTNATSFSTTNGVVYWDATRLVDAARLTYTTTVLTYGGDANANEAFNIDARGGNTGRAILRLRQSTNTNQATMEANWGMATNNTYTAPSANQIIFNFDAYAGDSALNETNYARFAMGVVSATDGSERGFINFWANRNGSISAWGTPDFTIRTSSSQYVASVGVNRNDSMALRIDATGGTSGRATLQIAVGDTTSPALVEYYNGVSNFSTYAVGTAGRVIGRDAYYAGDSASNETGYCRLDAVSATVTDGSEAGRFDWYVAINGTLTNTFQVTTGGCQAPSGYFLDALTSGSTGGFRAGASTDVVLYRGAADRWDVGTGDSFYVVSGNIGVVATPTATIGAFVQNGTIAIEGLVNDAGTNNRPAVIVARHDTSGAAAANYGADGLTIQYESAGGTNRTAHILRSFWAVATDAAEVEQFQHIGMSNGAAAISFEIKGTATTNAFNFALIQGNASPNYQSGVGIQYWGNRTTAPTGNPSAGLFVWVDGGAGTARGSGSTVTTWAPAGPHCEYCGQDAWTVAMRNVEWRTYLYICGRCGVRFEGGPDNVLGLLGDAERRQIIRRGMTYEEVEALVSF